MKKILALMILAIGMLVMWPPGSQVQAATSDQVSFVVDHQFVAPAAVMFQDNYTFDQIGNVKYQNVINCTEGGDVVIRETISDQRHLYLYEKPVLDQVNFTHSETGIRLCSSFSKLRNQNIQRNNVSVHPVRIRADTQEV